MKMTMPMTTSVLIIAAMIVSSTSLFVVVVEAFQPVVTRGIIQQQHQSRIIRTPLFIPIKKSRTRTNVIMYRIRCENKYYQLEELEDAENCTTELFLKENGDVEMGDTDGPLYTIATGKWEMINNQFAMSITKTYQTGNENKDVGVFTFDVERQFMGEMTVVGGTEVAVNGKIYAEDIITNKLDKEVGFFNMIDGTDVRLEKRDDARPTQNTEQGVGIEPSPIESKDVVGHEGIPKEWGITATELKLASEQVTGGSNNNDQQQQVQSAVGMETTYGQQQQQDYDAGSGDGGYGQQQPSPVQEGIPEYGGGNFGQQAQDYGGSGVSSGQQPPQQGNAYGYSSYDQQQQQQQQQQQEGGGLPEFGAGNFGQTSQGFGGGGGSGVDSSSSYGAGYGQQPQQQSPGSGYGYEQPQQPPPQQQQQQQQPNDPGPPSFSDYNYGQQQTQQQQSSNTNNNAGPPSFSDYNYGQQPQVEEQQQPQQGYDPQQQSQQSQGYWANDGTYYPNDSGGDEEVEVEEQTGEYDGSNYGGQQQQGQSQSQGGLSPMGFGGNNPNPWP